MAFTSAIIGRTVMGNKRVTYGTYTSASGSTGGDIDTGLTVVDDIQLQAGGSAVKTDGAVINETLPCDGSAVTIVTVADEVGTWKAFGR